MVMNSRFYEERADEAASEAKKATLENVRERALRSENVWRGMADRSRKIEHDRELAARDRVANDASPDDASTQRQRRFRQ